VFTRTYLLVWLSLCSALGVVSGLLGLLRIENTGGPAWSAYTFVTGALCGAVALGIWQRHGWAYPLFLGLAGIVLAATLVLSDSTPNVIVRFGVVVGSGLFLWRAAVGVRRAGQDAA
jgi:hypothetical protein